MYNTANSQTTAGFEQLYYVDPGASAQAATVVPRVYYRDKWYGEARYNYDETGTFSLYGGRTFSRQDSLSWSFTPVAGLLLGKWKGGATGINISVDYRKLSFTSEMQYTFSGKGRKYDFIYSWSELGYQVTGSWYAGLVLQQVCGYHSNNKWEPGVQLSCLLGKWTFPVYVFNPMSNDRRWVAGVTREWEWKRKH